MFLHLSVSHSVHRGVCLSACGKHPPPGRRLPLRTVRILLECILVQLSKEMSLMTGNQQTNNIFAFMPPETAFGFVSLLCKGSFDTDRHRNRNQEKKANWISSIYWYSFKFMLTYVGLIFGVVPGIKLFHWDHLPIVRVTHSCSK